MKNLRIETKQALFRAFFRELELPPSTKILTVDDFDGTIASGLQNYRPMSQRLGLYKSITGVTQSMADAPEHYTEWHNKKPFGAMEGQLDFIIGIVSYKEVVDFVIKAKTLAPNGKIIAVTNVRFLETDQSRHIFFIYNPPTKIWFPAKIYQDMNTICMWDMNPDLYMEPTELEWWQFR